MVLMWRGRGYRGKGVACIYFRIIKLIIKCETNWGSRLVVYRRAGQAELLAGGLSKAAARDVGNAASRAVGRAAIRRFATCTVDFFCVL
jgi:hypothetical protein